MERNFAPRCGTGGKLGGALAAVAPIERDVLALGCSTSRPAGRSAAQPPGGPGGNPVTLAFCQRAAPVAGGGAVLRAPQPRPGGGAGGKARADP